MTAGPAPGAVVVGTGIGVLTHLPALRAAGFEVHALVGRDPVKTAERAARFGVAHATTSLDEALALPAVDVVTVATPPLSHAEIVLAAVAAGKHVLCEKPLAQDTAEAVAMLRAAEAAGVVHLLGTEFRFWTPQALLTRLLREGAIGEPRFAMFVGHMGALLDPEAEMPSWFESAEEGGSWFTGAGSHTIDQIRTSLGEFDRVTASLQTLGRRPSATADDAFTVTFLLDSGVEGVMHGASSMPGPGLRATKVVGTKGAAWLDGFDVWLDDGSGPRQAPIPPDLAGPPPVSPPADLLRTAYDNLHSMGIDLDPYTRVYRVLRARILGEEVPAGPVAGTFADAVALQLVIDAVRRSAAEHTTVSVGPVP
jgi:predicted dehydrogenase